MPVTERDRPSACRRPLPATAARPRQPKSAGPTPDGGQGGDLPRVRSIHVPPVGNFFVLETSFMEYFLDPSMSFTCEFIAHKVIVSSSDR
jgi:hypothetical protein